MKNKNPKSTVIELPGSEYKSLKRGNCLEFQGPTGLIVVEVLNDCKPNEHGIIRPTVRPKAMRNPL